MSRLKLSIFMLAALALLVLALAPSLVAAVDKLETPVLSNSDNTVLTWQGIAGADAIELNYRHLGSAAWTSRVFSGDTVTFAYGVDPRQYKLDYGATYEARVRATSTDADTANSDWSNIVSMYVQDPDPPPPVAGPNPTATPVPPFPTATQPPDLRGPVATNTPKNLRAPDPRLWQEQGRVYGYHWNAVKGATGYTVRWRQSGGRWQTADLPASTTRYDFRKLAGETNFDIQIRALGDGARYKAKSKWSTSLGWWSASTATPTPFPTLVPPTATPTVLPRAEREIDQRGPFGTAAPPEQPTQTPKPPKKDPTSTPRPGGDRTETRSESRACSGGGNQSRTCSRTISSSGQASSWSCGGWSACPDPEPCNPRKQTSPSPHHVTKYELQGRQCWENQYLRSYWINECTNQTYTVDQFVRNVRPVDNC